MAQYSVIPTLGAWLLEHQYASQERAAIREIDGGQERSEAERTAQLEMEAEYYKLYPKQRTLGEI